LIIGVTLYANLKCEQANFDSALIDNQQLIDYLNKNGAKNVPEAPHNKEELKQRLKDKNLTEEQIQSILPYSLLD
jgi:hypothetical protein